MKSSTLTLALTILFSATYAQKTDTKDDQEKLLFIWTDWQKLAATGETDKILTYWADDAIIMSPVSLLFPALKKLEI